jgi:hypothetical protein
MPALVSVCTTMPAINHRSSTPAPSATTLPYPPSRLLETPRGPVGKVLVVGARCGLRPVRSDEAGADVSDHVTSMPSVREVLHQGGVVALGGDRS